MPTATTVPVSRRALLLRINRKLSSKNECVKASRGGSAMRQIGEFYLLRRGKVAETRVDLESLGRSLGVLASHEHVEP